MKNRVTYYANGEGRWWRTEWSPQCEESVLMAGQCQGTVGHKGVHWAFALHGSFCYDDNDDDPTEDGGAGSTPPGHKSYRTPEEMQEFYHLKFRTDSEVMDHGIIERLENDDPPEGINATINKPLSEDDPFYEECQRRMDAYREKHPDDLD